MSKHIWLITAVCTGTIATPALAQEATSALPAAGDIVVTAQKREQNLQKVPISMEVVSSKKLQDFNVTDFRQMVQFVPNVSVLQSTGNDAIYMRGFGSSPGNYAFDASVSLYVDGIYAGRPKQAQGPFFDLARVEVLRGPQGALFGKNTAAGAVSIVSAGPTRTFSGAVKALYNFDLKGPSFEGYVSGPLSEQLGARLAVKYLDQNGYITNRFSGRKEPATRTALSRLTLRYAPTETLDYTIKAEYADTRVRGNTNVSQSLTEPAHPGTHRYTASPNPFGPEGYRTKSYLVSGTGNLQIGDHVLTSVTGYSAYKGTQVVDFEQTIPSGGVTNVSAYSAYPERFHQFSQEVRLASPTGGTFEYLIGAYYDKAYFELTSMTGRNLPAYTGEVASDFRQNSSSWSGFGQATFRLTDQLRAVGSLRYSRTRKQATYASRLLSGFFPGVRTSAEGRKSEGSLDPSGTLQFDVTPKVMAYATYARGSKSGGFVSNTFGVTNLTFAFNPERSENYEAGVKSTLADGRLVLNASVYKTKFKDLQVSTYNIVAATFSTSNAGKAHSTGIEGSAAFYPTRNLDFTFSGAYQDVKYDDYLGGGCLATQPVSECNPLIPASTLTNNLRGTRLPFTSKLSYSGQAHHRLEIGSSQALDTTVSITGRSGYFTAQNLNPLWGYQKAFAKVAARLQYGAIDDRWHVALVGKNLTNRKTASLSYAFGLFATTSPRAFLQVDETRNIAVEAGFKF